MLVVGGKFFYVRAQVIQLCVVMYEIIAFDTAHHMLIIFNIFVLQWNKLKLMFFLNTYSKYVYFFSSSVVVHSMLKNSKQYTLYLFSYLRLES